MAYAPTGNLLLDSLSTEALRALDPHAKAYNNGAVLFNADETPDCFYFPHTTAVVSIIRATDDGSTVEAGVVGFEGIVNLQGVLASASPTGSRAVVQIEGPMSRVHIGAARALFEEDREFRKKILTFTSAFIEQVMQNLVCNRLHAIEQRLAKWLLTVGDRIGPEAMHLTQEFLAHMLGIHRPGVSIAVTALETDGLIAHSRNMIAIRDRAGLVGRACECYSTIHASLLDVRATLATSELGDLVRK